MKLGLLNAYNFDQVESGYQADYAPMFKAFLHEVMPQVQVVVYEVPALKNLPDPNECDAWLIGGSGKSAYDKDEWIGHLQDWVRQAHAQKSKLIGVCFGHQLIAQALGGEVRKSPNGWGVGVKEFEILTSPQWMNDKEAGKSNKVSGQVNLAGHKVNLLFSHQDQVEELPLEAVRLASSEFCPNQIFMVGDNTLCMQGHPEFSKQFMRDRLQARKEQIGESTYKEALASLEKETDHLDVGRWIERFLKSKA